MRLNQAARKLNIGTSTIIDFLRKKGFDVEENPNGKITDEQYELLKKEFHEAALEKKEASAKQIKHKDQSLVITPDTSPTSKGAEDTQEEFLVTSRHVPATPSDKKNKEKEDAPIEKAPIETPKLSGPKILGTINLDEISPKKGKAEKDKKSASTKAEKKVDKPTFTQPATSNPEAEAGQPAASEQSTLASSSAEKEKQEPVDPTPNMAIPTETQPTENQLHHTDTTDEEASASDELIRARAERLKGLQILGKIDLDQANKSRKAKPIASSDEKKRSRVRIKKKKKDNEALAESASKTHLKDESTSNTSERFKADKKAKLSAKKKREKENEKKEISSQEVKEQLKATLAKISSTGKKKPLRKRKEKVTDESIETSDTNLLQVTEFISTGELAQLMEVPVNEVITKCIQSGIFVSINQRLEADIIELIAAEYGYQVEFISAEEEIAADIAAAEEEDQPEDLVLRPPVVTVMGHVDHGKTSLLDYIRKTNVTAKEAGGITQHIGAYSVTTADGKKVTFLDTPGHEAFTAMRARGAKVTDVAIIVVAADDSVMPQTIEAINHAQAAGVPIVIAINKIDKPTANPERVKEQLAKINILVEDWGGPYQCQHVSAKTGEGINELLEKVLLEAELLELKANPHRKASGTVIEAALDKGKGYVATLLVQNGTLHIGDIILAGTHYGRVKAMTDHTGKRLKEAGPSTPVQILGLNGAPQAGDKFNVMDSDKDAREIANRREQILREQRIRATDRISLETLSRRRALGDYKQLNLIIKGDVDGSVEALSDALLKLSKPDEIEVRIVHRGVGQITESDVNLAAVSDAIILGFQVRPSANAKKLAEQESVEIRLYSIIYEVIDDVKNAMEGMLSPTVEEVIVGNAEVRETFHISKVGTVAGCYVTDGYIKRNSNVRVVRDGTVIHTGELASLKRFKDDVSEVKAGFECGMAIKSFNDIREGDIIEAFERREIKRTLD